MFMTKRRKAIADCVIDVRRDVSGWLIPPTVAYAAKMLQRRLSERGIMLSLDKACKAMSRRPH